MSFFPALLGNNQEELQARHPAGAKTFTRRGETTKKNYKSQSNILFLGAFSETTKKNYNFEYLVAPYGKSGEVLAEDTWL